MKNTSLKITLGVLILIVILGSIFLFLRYYNGTFLGRSIFISQTTEIKPEIIKIADDYVISQVGLDYFKENYVHLQDADKATVHPGNYTDYEIHYEYLPASRISGKQQALVAHIRNDNLLYMNGVYDCLKESFLCELTVDKQNAFEKAKDKGFFDNNQDYSIVLLHTFDKMNGWYWKITRQADNSEPSDCFKSFEIEINASTGETSTIEEKKAC